MAVGDVQCAEPREPRRFLAASRRVASIPFAGVVAWFVAVPAAASAPPAPAFDPLGDSSWHEIGSLDILDVRPPSAATAPRITGIGRVTGGQDPDDAVLGTGGVDLSWRPDDRISVAMIAGGMMDRIDEGGFNHARSSFEVEPIDPLESLAGRSKAFDGLDFGGFSASPVSPFDSNRVMTPVMAEDRLRSMFLATRAIVRPLDGTSIGFIATHGGSVENDRSLVGFDLGQRIGTHRVDVWFQQSLGSQDQDEISGQDRMALGASLGGSLDSLRYKVGWRQIGDAFESGLGRSGTASANSLVGSLDWALPIEGLPLLARVELGVSAAMDADAEFDADLVDIEIDAIRFISRKGHRLELGMVQQLRPDLVDGEGLVSSERYRVAVQSDPSAALKLRGQVDLGEHGSDTSAMWNGAARWNPGGGFHIGGSVRAESRTDDIEMRETILTSIDGGFKVGRHASINSSLGFDAARDHLSLGHSLGWAIQNNASLSLRVEQQLPITGSSADSLNVRASIGGRFTF